MARTRQIRSEIEGAGPSKIMQETSALDTGRKKRLPSLSRIAKTNYVPSAEFDDIMPFDSRHIEVARRAKLRQMIHDVAFERQYTMRTEHHGANYLKEQLDNGYPELESFNRAVKLMSTRKVND